MSNPFISIVIVNYNSGNYLEQAICSIINQSSNDWELIMVDGGSTDNSLGIITKYKEYFSWCISEPDKGQSDAFNKGFSHAKGQFYTWLNADDLMLPGTIDFLKRYIERRPSCKWLALNTVYIDGDNNVLTCSKGVSHNNFVLKHGVLTEVAPSTIFHSDIYNSSMKFNLSCFYTMDTELWIQFVNKGYSYKRVNKFGWGFRMHGASKTANSILQGKSTEKQRKEYMTILKNNNVKQHGIILLWQKLLRIFYSRPISLLYTIIYKGRNISIIK